MTYELTAIPQWSPRVKNIKIKQRSHSEAITVRTRNKQKLTRKAKGMILFVHLSQRRFEDRKPRKIVHSGQY